MTSPGTPEVCSRCRAVVIVAVTQKNGKRMPLDRFPADDGTVELVPASYGPPVAIVHGGPEPGQVRYRVHFPTCEKRAPRPKRGRGVRRR